MRFDWYAATIPDTPNRVISTLADGLGAEPVPGRAMHGYTQGIDFQHPDRGTVARLLCGGNRGANPNAWASGDDTDKFVSLVREAWPARHYVTRMDAAQDTSEPGCFDRLRAECRSVAESRGMRFPAIEDPLNPGHGRTQYIGSRKSRVFGRLYEKGKQLLERAHLSALSGAYVIDQDTGEVQQVDDLTRLELVVRPEKEGRELAAVCTPEQAWGFTDWSQELAARVFDLQLHQVYVRHRKGTADDATLAWMCQQYRHILNRLADRSGGWCGAGERIGQLVAEIEAQKPS